MQEQTELPEDLPADVSTRRGLVADVGSEDAQRGQLAIVTFSHAIQHIYVAGLAVAYPFVVTSFHVSYGALGIVLGVAGIIGGLLQAIAGSVRKVSARVLLSLQNFGMAIASLMGGLASGFVLFGAARCIGSVVSWPQHPVGSALLARRFPARRAYALSWHVAGGSIGTAVIPLVISALIASYGWHVAVAALAVPMAIGGVLVAWKLKDVGGGASATRPATDRASPAAPAGGHLDAVRGILHSRTALGAMIAGTIAAGGRGLGTLAVFVPAYLKSGLHLHALWVGALFSALVIGSIAGPVLAGHLADRMGRRRVLLVVYVVGAATIAAFVLVGRDLLAVGAVGVLVGVFAYAESPLLQAVFADGLDGVGHQSTFGYYFAISYGVGSLWTIALGEIIATAGFRWAFFVMSMSFLVAAAVVWWSRPSPRRTGSPGPRGAPGGEDWHAAEDDPRPDLRPDPRPDLRPDPRPDPRQA
ncbi:MAG: MFS transporter [Actinomycetota bacterium]|nr:MFS transporter [Actinomycetota bacterium]